MRNAVSVQSTEFWQVVDIFVTVLQRIYVTLRANDSEVPGTPDIYFRMSSGLAARRQGKTNEQLCGYRAKRCQCPVDGVLAGC